jgi:acyl transferase domain-containing protein/acyl carrier protein
MTISDQFAHMSPLKQALLALEEMDSKLNKIEHQQAEPIAIIGIGCRFPGGANDPDSFWQLLHNGVDAIQEVPSNRWDINSYYDPNPETIGKMYTRQGGFLDIEIDKFDAEFFGLAPREVVSMDPQQRLLLEVSWQALENAGQSPEKLTGSQTGIFVGINTSDYSQLYMKSRNASNLDAYFFLGNTSSVAAGRLSYILGFQGPSIAIDTACSSSLVTIHTACQSLRTGECHLALAGGVNLMLSPEAPIVLSRMRALAPDGRCKTFDAAADGYGRGEGCGMVVLKRLSDAVRDGDRILAQIRGSAVNHDGRSSGLTVPNGLVQQKLINAALANAKLEPNLVSYVEVHGTGTALGDPIEVEALANALCKKRSPKQPLMIGSVKTNIGHLEAAAGVAGLIKVVLAMQHREIPTHLHLKTPNPAIAWDDLPIAIVATEQIPWFPAGGQPRLAGVSSFGMSGTNAHVLLEEAPTHFPVNSEVERPIHLLTLSAKSEAALKKLTGLFEKYLQENPSASLADICFTASNGRSHFPHRLALVAEAPTQLLKELTAFTTDKNLAEAKSGLVSRTSPSQVAFLFTGQGSQYVNMGRELYETQPTFRQALERCDQLLHPELEQPLLSVLYPDTESNSLLEQTAYTQPALFALEYALAHLWQSWGIKPAIVMGHSVGEYVAACIAGVFSLEDGLKLIAARGRLMQALPPDGEMVAVFADEAQVTAAIEFFPKEISIAAINGPKNIVISGKRSAVQVLLQQLKAEKIEFRQLNVSHAFHSPLMEPMLSSFEEIAGSVEYSSPQIRIISNLTGKLVEGKEIAQAEYWCRHIRETVRFSASIQTLHEQGYELFIEIGPQPTLLGMGRRCLPETGVWLPSLRKGISDWLPLLQSLGELYVRGVDVDWDGFDRDYGCQRLQLPTYPFERSRYWIESDQKSPENHQPLQAFEDWLYQVEWQPKSSTLLESALGDGPSQHSYWLIFADENSGVSSALAALLEERGETSILVFAGESYETLETGHYKINPRQPQDYQRLLTEVGETNKLSCSGIIYSWSLDNTLIAETVVDTLDRDQTQSCGSVLYLVQALSSAQISHLPHLWIVTQNAQPIKSFTNSLALAQTPLLGLGRVIAVEHPELWGGLIDLDSGNSQEAAANCLQEIWQPGVETEVAFRQGQRYVPRLVRHQTFPALAKTIQLRSDATYLITGGLGGLGIDLAKWMVSQGARHLVLVGRSGASSGASEEIRQLKEAGAEILVVQADISQESEVKRILSDIAQSLPPLSGIIHLAGVLDDGVLLRQDWERFAKVMTPKVAGAWNLHSQTQDLVLDFFVLFSSIASLLGSPGQGNYAAANAFLDGLAHYRRLQQLPALSINWSPWGETGMAAGLGRRGEQRWTAAGINVIAPHQGLQVLEHLLSQSDAQISVLPVEWSKFFGHLPSDVKPPFFSHLMDELGSISSTESPSQQPQHELLDRLKAAPSKRRLTILVDHIQKDVTAVLGRDSSRLAELQLGFFEMGMDSLMTLELKNRLQGSLGYSLPATLTYEYPTIEALAEHLLNKVLCFNAFSVVDAESQEDTKQQTEALVEIENLSIPELEALVDYELAALVKGK